MNEHLLQPSFTLGEIKDRAIELTRKHWTTYLLIGLVGFAVIAPIEIVNAVWEMKYGAGIFPVILSVVSIILQMILVIAITRYSLAASEDKSLPFKEYFTCNVKMVVAMALASLLYVIMMAAGLVALIVPGIILGIAFSFYSFPVVEKNMNAIDSLKVSWNITKGNKKNIFIFSLALGVVGLVVLVVPMVIAMLPMLLNMQGALVVTMILGFFAFIWLIIAGIAIETFGTIASALMYRKMQATRKIEK